VGRDFPVSAIRWQHESVPARRPPSSPRWLRDVLDVSALRHGHSLPKRHTSLSSAPGLPAHPRSKRSSRFPPRVHPASIPRTPTFETVRTRPEVPLTRHYRPLPSAEIRPINIRDEEVPGSSPGSPTTKAQVNAAVYSRCHPLVRSQSAKVRAIREPLPQRVRRVPIGIARGVRIHREREKLIRVPEPARC
jgi:hypothetical protein